MYPRARIHAWKKNPRTGPLDVSDILATLTPGRGITEPLRLRKEGEGYVALKGNRRLMAAAIRELEELPGIEVTWSDEQALEEALVDEARKALTPLEEAAALVRLRDRGLELDAIAARAGRTVRHVRQRFALHDALGPEGKDLLAGGRISPTLGLQLATLGLEAQHEVLVGVSRRERDGEPMTAREVKWEIDRGRLRLVDGGFPLDDAKLLADAGPCTTCPKRTGVQAELFADGITEQNLCTNKA
jgi:ParB family chromosome partitioning protein